MNNTVHQRLIAGTAGLQLVILRLPNGQLCQAIELGDGDNVLPILAQPTGDASADTWPPCPPVQECLNHSGLDNVLLTTGMAGKAHWSSAIEAKEAAGSAFIEWDVACRTGIEPDFLGSVWQVAGDATVHSNADGATVELAAGDETRQITISAAEGASIDIRQEDAQTLIVVTCIDDQDDLPRTFRWKYRIGVAAPD